jgi:hypothetical protein
MPKVYVHYQKAYLHTLLLRAVEIILTACFLLLLYREFACCCWCTLSEQIIFNTRRLYLISHLFISPVRFIFFHTHTLKSVRTLSKSARTPLNSSLSSSLMMHLCQNGAKSHALLYRRTQQQQCFRN